MEDCVVKYPGDREGNEVTSFREEQVMLLILVTVLAVTVLKK